MKRVHKSKTMIFSVLLAILSVVQGFILQFHIGPDAQMYLGLGVAVVIAVLRIITTGPIGNDDGDRTE